jgi:alanyl-tRNA synthetase
MAMKTNEIREKYLDFFRSKGHTIVPSDVLVPKWDPTVLFTPAGMNQFKDHFLGKVELQFTRAATSQKCLRTGDIENVGRTAYHHTFFEMLGNFSFGDYFKKEAIIWAWEFLTSRQWLGIDPNRLTVSVFLDDDEAANIWHQEIGLPFNRINRMGEHDNFWPAGAPTDGPDGVCGPCSEIFYHPDNGPECEIWNLVFTQFNRVGDPPNNLIPLPSRNIDTGMGLERIAATMQGVSTNFHIDILKPIVDAAAESVGKKYQADTENGRRLRRIADHVRACAMAIHENVYPGANKEEYVIRRLLRRAVLQGHEMGVREPFLYRLVPAVVEQMAQPYPELLQTVDRVAAVIKNEESNFFGTLDSGLARIEAIFDSMKTGNSQTVVGQEAFDLYQTYGIPAELFASIADERGLKFDWPGYQQAILQHGIDSGAGSKGVMGDFGPLDDIKREIKTTEFLGYSQLQAQARICGLVQQFASDRDQDQDQDQVQLTQRRVHELSSADDAELEQYVVLSSSPFYAESGGQVGDSGWIIGTSGKFQVTDTQKTGEVIIHMGRLIEGSLQDGEAVQAIVDQERRDAIRRAHSATHVLHYALQQNLGEHAQQRGSKVVDDLLRFDFANLKGVEPRQLAAIESLVLEKIQQGGPVKAEILPLETAKQSGAMMLFGEKYPDPVRMISIGDFSKELCGGTHVEQIQDVQAFELISEENISSGTRRIQALTGLKAHQFKQRVEEVLIGIANRLEVPAVELNDAVETIYQRAKSLKKRLSAGGGSDPGGSKADPLVGQWDPARIWLDTSGNQLNYHRKREILKTLAHRLNVGMFEVEERVLGLRADIDTMLNQLARQSDQRFDLEQILQAGEKIGDFDAYLLEIPDGDAPRLKQLVDQIRRKISPVAIFFATSEGPDRVLLVAGFSRELVERGWSAGDWIKEIAPVVGGRGGGKPDLAQAGGKLVQEIGSALSQARNYLVQRAQKSQVG